MSRSLATRTASPNSPKLVTTLHSMERRLPENRFVFPPSPISPPRSTAPNAETPCCCLPEPLSMSECCPQKNATTSTTSRCEPTRLIPVFPPKAPASHPHGAESPACLGVHLLPSRPAERRSCLPPW